MGAYAPLPWLPAGFTDEVVRTVAQPTVDEMARRGTPFAGLLYVGLAMTTRGARVVEFNARFGDPETQVVLALLETPLGRLLHAAATGALGAQPPLRWRDGAAVTVVAGRGRLPRHAAGRRRDHRRPNSPASSTPAPAAATTARSSSSGGRVLSATAVGATLAAAREQAYALVDRSTCPAGSSAATSRCGPSAARSWCDGLPRSVERVTVEA